MDNRFSAPDDLTPSDGNSFPADGGLEQADLPAYDDPSGAELRLDSDGYQVRADADEPQEDAPDAEPDDGQRVFYTNAADIGRMPAKRRSTGRKVGRGFAIAGKIIVAVALALAILVGGLLGYLTVTEYNPAYAEVAEPGTVSATPSLSKRCPSSASMERVMLSISLSPRRWNTMVSSTRLRNSGRKVAFSSSMT